MAAYRVRLSHIRAVGEFECTLRVSGQSNEFLPGRKCRDAGKAYRAAEPSCYALKMCAARPLNVVLVLTNSSPVGYRIIVLR